MRSSTRLLALAALAIAVCSATGALALDKQEVLKQRETLMKRQASDLGAIKGYLDGKVDQAKAIAAATDLTRTMVQIPSVFPPGTADPSPDGKFAPKPAVWSDWKGFLAHRETALHKSEALLASVKGGDAATIKASFIDLGKNGCGACHETFREKLKD